MRPSDIKGEEALDVLADIIEPAGNIFGDKEVVELFNQDKKVKAVAVAIRKYKKDVIKIMATLDREDPKTYEVNLISLPAKVLEILNDPDVMELFSSQGQNTEETSSGSATENTEAPEM